MNAKREGGFTYRSTEQTHQELSQQIYSKSHKGFMIINKPQKYIDDSSINIYKLD